MAPRLRAWIDPVRLFWGNERDWQPWVLVREDGLRVTLGNDPHGEIGSVVITPRSGRATAEHQTQVEHLLGMEPGTLKRRLPMHAEFDSPHLPVLEWLETEWKAHRPPPPSPIEKKPPTGDQAPVFILKWETRPLALRADCESCGLHAYLTVRAIYPATPDDFESRARVAEGIARKRLQAQDERWRDCRHLATERVSMVALCQMYERRPRPVLPPIKDEIVEGPRYGKPKQWCQRSSR